MFIVLSFSLCFPTTPHCTAESHFPKYCPTGGTDKLFQADIAFGNHMFHKALSHMSVSESSRLYCLTTAALRGKSFLSVAVEGCHYCWALNIIIRGYKLCCCQGWSGCHKGIIIFMQSSLAVRHNIWIILSMRRTLWLKNESCCTFLLHIWSSVFWLQTNAMVYLFQLLLMIGPPSHFVLRLLFRGDCVNKVHPTYLGDKWKCHWEHVFVLIMIVVMVNVDLF